MDPTVLFGSVCVVLGIGVLWWSLSSAEADETVSLAGGSAGTDQRRLALKSSATDRTITPLVAALGARVRRILPAQRVKNLEANLRRAGLDEKWTIDRVVAGKVLGGLVLFVFFFARFSGAPSAGNLVLLVAATALGFFLPNLLVGRRVEERKMAIRKDVADAIDQLNVMVRAGLGIDDAIARLAQHGEGPLAEEFGRVMQDMRFGLARNVAFANMSERVDVPELSGFVTALAHAERLGVPISQTLKIQSHEMRERRRQTAEEEAMKLPVKILFPMVFCILPTMFIVLLGPAAMRLLDQF